MILNVGCGGRPKDKACYLGDVRIDAKRYSPVTIVMDAHRLGFRDSTFDEIYCFEVLEHVESPMKVLRELKRVLKSDGRVIITVPNVWYWRTVYKAVVRQFWRFNELPTTDHKQAWDIDAFHNLAYQVGFRIIQVEWIDWYPRGKHKLDPIEPILKRILPSAFYFKHVLFKVKVS